MYNAHYSGRMKIKLEFSRRIFETSSNMKVHKNSTDGSMVGLRRRIERRIDRQTDRQTDGETDITN